MTMADKIIPSWATQEHEQEFAYRNVELFKNEILGTGSYGAVCKARCDQLICAAKLLYPVLFQMQALNPSKDHRQPIRRFEYECQFLRRINHPNIVQYLGTYHDAETNAPVLLMELMDESLTHFLEASPGDIPYHIQVNLSYDIAQALAFLHSNGIIHRDLSSNNVLLNAGNRAKVTDFGMSKLTDGDIVHLATMTTCPGTPAFMSPEALNEPPVYTDNLDNFSFGVLLVQMMTRKFPKPTDRFEVVKIPSPRNPSRTVEAKVAIPEIERRQAHINLIEPTHPLLLIALCCLKDWDLERPSSQQLCETLETLKDSALYERSCQQDEVQLLRHQIRVKEEQLRVKNDLIRAKDEQIQYTSQLIHEEIGQLTEKLEEASQNTQALQINNLVLQNELESKDKQLRQAKQIIDSYETIAAKLQEAIAERDREMQDVYSSKDEEIQQLSSLLYQVPTQDDTLVESDSQPGTTIPVDLVVGSSTVVEGKAYFRSLGSKHIRQFDSSNDRWTRLSTHPLDACTITNVNNVLTSVGGRSGANFSNKLYSYIDKQWVEHLPPMSTKCQTPAAVCAKNTLVVAGGYNRSILTTVETLNTLTMQWSNASCLPFSTEQPSAAICGDEVYVHAGYTSSEQDKYSVIKCSLNELVDSTPISTDLWEGIGSLPVRGSSLLTVDDHLMAVGGLDSRKNRTKDVYQYNPTNDSWQVASQMQVTLSFGLTACLPGNMLMVVGGYFTTQKIEATVIH
ncbi:serine/threonine-protein kinase 36-like [Halichondria panicea]|uniref:serine/threonine-protein kinase 36-like n=1 Tax=Halichondria panicea TaxID=6063 RepID=UPI00312B863D